MNGDGPRYPVVWPSGTRLVEDNGSLIGVDVPGFGVVAIGKWLIGGGGKLTDASESEPLPAVPAECKDEYEQYSVVDRIEQVVDTRPES
jgi:hypothetical protein